MILSVLDTTTAESDVCVMLSMYDIGT